MHRAGPPSRELASTSYASTSPHQHRPHMDNVRVGRKVFVFSYNGHIPTARTQALIRQERRPVDNKIGHRADAAHRPVVKRQVMERSTVPEYVPLSQAQEIISEAVDASSPPPPLLLKFCESGQQVTLHNTNCDIRHIEKKKRKTKV
jgi:hypothetical protein